MRILGVSAFYHDSAAVLVRDGEVVAACQEERFSRKKHDAGFPSRSVEWCLAQDGVRLSDIDFVAFYDKPFLKFERLLETYLAFAPRGFRSFRTALPVWLREKLYQKNLLRRELAACSGCASGKVPPLLFSEHHFSHAASAFYLSPFDRAAVLTIDGVGEWATSTCGLGEGKSLAIVKEISFPHSLGLLYSAFTQYLGFKVNSGEYKVMGLAPYGEPEYKQLILDNLLDVKPDGSFRLNLRYFDYCTGLSMTNSRFHDLFGGAPREPGAEITRRHMDLAASIQCVMEEVVLRLIRSLARETGEKDLCLAGGVALNCVANGKALRDRQFQRIWVQPASGDAGGALGAALAAYHIHAGHPRTAVFPDGMKGALLGPSYSQSEIEERLARAGARFSTHDEASVLRIAVDALSQEQIVGWFQGRMEFGPRALGARSILADPRSSGMQSKLNLKVKYRESFRPFAPSVLCEDAAEWFDLDAESPYMTITAPVAGKRRRELTEAEQALCGFDRLALARSEIPAVTHVDYSSRVQTVNRLTNPRYHALLSAFKERTGCPVLVNTSFNVRGEPIVCTPEEAFRCFMGTEMDLLIAGNCVLRKQDQPQELAPPNRHRREIGALD